MQRLLLPIQWKDGVKSLKCRLSKSWIDELISYRFLKICSRKVWQEGHHNLDIIAGYCGYEMTNHHALADAEDNIASITKRLNNYDSYHYTDH